jgi:hypothetical protein
VASRSETRLDESDVDVGEELDALEQLIERCKVLYEQYFMGIQKVAPETLHRQAERRMLKLTQGRIRNTALRFRFTTLSQKYGSYNTYWRRTMRAIEQGRYVKHLAAAARRAERLGKEMPDELLQKMPKRLREKLLRDRANLRERADREDARQGGKRGKRDEDEAPAVVRQAKPHQHQVADIRADEVDFDAMFDAIQTDEKGAPLSPAPAPKPVAAKPAPVAAPVPRPPRPVLSRAPKRDSSGNALPPGMSEHQTRDLFDKFVKAKKLVGESTDRTSYAKLLRTLNKQAPKILQQHGAKSVEFNVVIKNDRVVLKAKPKK